MKDEIKVLDVITAKLAKFDIYETALKHSNEIWRDKKLSAEDKVKAYEDILLHVNEFLYELKGSE